MSLMIAATEATIKAVVTSTMLMGAAALVTLAVAAMVLLLAANGTSIVKIGSKRVLSPAFRIA